MMPSAERDAPGVDKTALNGLSDAEYRRAHQRLFPVRYVVTPLPLIDQDPQDFQDSLNEMAAQGFDLLPVGPILVGDPAYGQDPCLIWRAGTSVIPPGEGNDAREPFRWDLQTDDGGLPAHLPMGVTQDGRGPTSDSEAHHYLCWCGDPKCLLNDALRLSWESGTRVTSPAGTDS